MDHNFYSIVEKLAILEGRITPTHEHIAESKQKKPALFNNLKKEEKTEEDFTPGVGGVEFAEEKSDDVLSKVKASLVDYLKSAEDSLKQDKDLIAKKKQDLDLKKKELKDLELQQKHKDVEEAIPDSLDEDPNQTPAQGEAPAGLTDPTYAESTAPVKTVNVPVEDVGIGSGGGGSILVEIHGDERNGFCIKRAGKELPSRFKSLEECEIALEMYMARRKAKHDAEQSADYIEEK